MFTTLAKTFAVTAFALMPMATAAAVSTDLNIDQSYSINELIASGTSSTVFTFTANERLRINGFALGGFGNNAFADLGRISYTLSNPAATGILAVTALPAPLTLSFGAASVPGGTFDLGDTFTVTFNMSQPAARPLTVFTTFDTAAVPIPAAGLMLLAALGGVVALRRRKTPAPA